MKRLLSLLTLTCSMAYATASNVVWKIGEADNSAADMALGLSGYKQFLAHDFGYEDRYFMIENSVADRDFPYVLPGPDDTWGGTWNTAGWRTHEANILFGIDKLPSQGQCKLVVILVDAAPCRSVVKTGGEWRGEEIRDKRPLKGRVGGRYARCRWSDVGVAHFCLRP